MRERNSNVLRSEDFRRYELLLVRLGVLEYIWYGIGVVGRTVWVMESRYSKLDIVY